MKNKQQRVYTVLYRLPGDEKNRMATSTVKRTGDEAADRKNAEGYVIEQWPTATITSTREGNHPYIA